MVRSRAIFWAIAIGGWVAAAPNGTSAGTAGENYRHYCIQCHGTLANGRGVNNTVGALAVSPRDHTNAKEMSKLSDRDLRLAIARGGDAVSKSELMPPWGGVLTAGEIDDLVAYLRNLCRCRGKN